MIPVRGFILSIVVFTAACGSDGDAEAPADFDAEMVPLLVVEEELRIGSVDDPDYGFSSIGAVQEDADGNVYVFERQDLQLRAYDRNGRLLRRIGRRGGGPGEFEDNSLRFGLQGDTIWVVEPRSHRVTLLDLGGAVRGTSRFDEVRISLNGPGETSMIVPLALGPDGFFVGDRGPAQMAPGTGRAEFTETIDIPRVRFEAGGRVVDTAGFYPLTRYQPEPEFVEVGSSTYIMPSPPFSEPLSIITPDGRYVVERPVAAAAERGSFRVTRLDLAGDTVHTTSFRYRPRALPASAADDAAVRAAHVDRPMLYLSGAGVVRLQRHAADSARARAVIRARLDFPEYQVPVQSYHVGDDQRLWLRREAEEGRAYRWLVLEPDGTSVGELELPRGRSVVWSGRDHLWVIERDEFDVPWLVRYGIMPTF